MWAPEGASAAAADTLEACGIKLGSDALLQLSGAVRAAGHSGWQELSGVGEKLR